MHVLLSKSVRVYYTYSRIFYTYFNRSLLFIFPPTFSYHLPFLSHLLSLHLHSSFPLSSSVSSPALSFLSLLSFFTFFSSIPLSLVLPLLHVLSFPLSSSLSLSSVLSPLHFHFLLSTYDNNFIRFVLPGIRSYPLSFYHTISPIS